MTPYTQLTHRSEQSHEATERMWARKERLEADERFAEPALDPVPLPLTAIKGSVGVEVAPDPLKSARSRYFELLDMETAWLGLRDTPHPSSFEAEKLSSRRQLGF